MTALLGGADYYVYFKRNDYIIVFENDSNRSSVYTGDCYINKIILCTLWYRIINCNRVYESK